MHFSFKTLFFLLIFSPLFSSDAEELMRDLLLVERVDRALCNRFPLFYNHLLQGGYFNMPSARMGKEGEVSFGYAQAPPYRHINARFQPFPFLEVTGNYRIFSNIPDPNFGQLGFGDLADKGANLKLALIRPEESGYELPGIALGWEDFLGTCSFKGQYLVATQVFPGRQMEISLGWGRKRFKGLFGGLCWMPFRVRGPSFLRQLALSAEYDSIDYGNPKREPHPEGREIASRINWGAKLRLFDSLDLSLSRVRGREVAFSASLSYNLGESSGFLPKIHDPLLRAAPMEPLSDDLALLFSALEKQGLYLLEAKSGEKTLWLKIYNCKWSLESSLRRRLNCLLSHLLPPSFERVVVVATSKGFSIQEYRYRACFLDGYREAFLSDYELNLLTPLCEAGTGWGLSPIFHKERPLYAWQQMPKTKLFFGSSRGKFKCALGWNLGVQGYLFADIYYRILLGWMPYNSIHDLCDRDILNPSRLIRVRTDAVLYYKYKGATLDQAFLQKNLHLFGPLYMRLAGGYFSQMYGGVSSEWLFYPVSSNWAVGIEGALLKKREISGIGLTDRIAKLEGNEIVYKSFLGSQYFIDLYWTIPSFQIDLKASLGRFLAGDRGIRYEASRHFPNGFRAGIWYSVTDANDRINGSIYRDKGIFFSMPLDFFYTYSSRKSWDYSMAAWLRDSAYRTEVGEGLYDPIRSHRFL